MMLVGRSVAAERSGLWPLVCPHDRPLRSRRTNGESRAELPFAGHCGRRHLVALRKLSRKKKESLKDSTAFRVAEAVGQRRQKMPQRYRHLQLGAVKQQLQQQPRLLRRLPLRLLLRLPQLE